jgi:putative spermidine/putrescine transport system permease protein
MAVLIGIQKTKPSFYVPVVAAAGALAGLLVGTAQGLPLLGVLLGAAIMAGLAYVLVDRLDAERPSRWALTGAGAVAGFLFGGPSGLLVGLGFGWFFGWFIFWLSEGRYRAGLPPYLTGGQVLWHHSFRVICGAILVFLITPILVVMPLSFNAQDFFTFTPEMLRLDPAGYSLKHYRDFFTSDDWQQALRNSLLIAPVRHCLPSVSARWPRSGSASRMCPAGR